MTETTAPSAAPAEDDWAVESRAARVRALRFLGGRELMFSVAYVVSVGVEGQIRAQGSAHALDDLRAWFRCHLRAGGRRVLPDLDSPRRPGGSPHRARLHRGAVMTHAQKHKSMKRPRSWHHRGAGPDRAWRRAIGRIEAALSAALVADDPYDDATGFLDTAEAHRRGQERSLSWLGPDPTPVLDPPYESEVDRFMANIYEHGDWTEEDRPQLDVIVGRWADRRAGR